MKLAHWTLSLLLLAVMFGTVAAQADETKTNDSKKNDKPAANEPTAADPAPTGPMSSSSGSGGASAPAPRPKYPPFSEVAKDFTPVEGLIKLYRKDNRLLAELTPDKLNRDFIVLTSIAKGIGEGMLLGGMTWGFGDDWLWQFRKVDDNIHVVRRNVRFKANRGSPEEKAVRLAYTDSVLFALPIMTQGPNGGIVVDFSQIFMSDLPQISRMLPGFVFSGTKSTWAAVKGFKDNVELEVAATYASAGGLELDTVPDSRGLTVNVHYSISLLPETGYQPRMADDRVGYFLTVVKDFSKKATDFDRFVRYINRWDLQKADPMAEKSPPKKPIVFWLEKTVPYQYRQPIREGILEWNKAFEKAGYLDAIEVRQQPDNADWDPEDINYNTFRWITAGAGFAMGPSRVNPMTGQILDADIIFDSDFVQFWKREYEIYTPASIAAMTGGPLDLHSYQEEQSRIPFLQQHGANCRCELHRHMSREFALGATAMLAADPASAAQIQEKMIMQGLKEVTMHEVGHTLGLRHNFKSSTIYNLTDMQDREKTKETGLTGSVMDYTPVNLVPKGMKQGDFYSTTVGPYDMWAIEYGYKPFSGSPESEVKDLQKIAARSGEPLLTYATDEDTRGIDSDPYSNRFDMGKDPIEFTKLRSKIVNELLPDVINKVTKEGEGYQRGRQAFGVLLGNYGLATFFSARMIGGIEVSRHHKGDANAKPPFTVVPVAKQREALELIEKTLLGDKPFNVSPDVYNYLAASRWSHWGVNEPERLDYAVHDVIAMWQNRVLDHILSPLTLTRIHDSELKIPADQDALTTAELIARLTKSIFSELDSLKPGEYSNRKPAVSSLRRNLQRLYLKRLASITLGTSRGDFPEDVQTVVYAQLKALQAKLEKASEQKLDDYTKAHFQDSAARIEKALDARVSVTKP
jgi:hypothetical protein